MTKKSISVMIVPHTEARVYNFHIPLAIIYTVSISLFVIFVAFSLLMIDYHQVKKEVATLAPLNKQLVLKNNQLESAQSYQSQEIQKLNKVMRNLEKFDEKLRVMTGLEVKEEKVADDGKGGPMDDGASVDQAAIVELQNSLGHQQEKTPPNEINNLRERALIRQQSLSELESYLDSQKNLLAATPSIWPVNGWIKQGFGIFVSPFTGYREEHNGVDIVARVGTPIVATADGRVTFSGRDGDDGLKVVIDHGNGYETSYAHNYVNKVSRGAYVKRGQIIATCGNSGLTRGPHLFYTVKVKDKYVDPKDFFLN